MPATDSSANLASIGRSILSLRRDQLHHHAAGSPEAASAGNAELETDAFQHHVADLLVDLSDAGAGLLSLSWTRRFLDGFLICLEEFRAVLLASGASALSRAPVDRFVLDFLDRAVKALDLCNAVRDGVDQIRQWRKHLAIAVASLDVSDRPLGEGQIRRARKALTDVTILMLDEKDAGSVVGHRNRSFGRGNKDSSHGSSHHSRSGSGGSSSSSSGGHFRSLSWTMSRTWSAARQLQAISSGLTVPRGHNVTTGLSSTVFTMGAMLFIVSWVLVAAIPCQDRGLQVHFTVPRGVPWAAPMTAIYERTLEESKKKERKNTCGLLKEIIQIEHCSRKLMDLTDGVTGQLSKEKEAEVREGVLELAQVCDALQDGLDPLEKQVREVFHRIIRSRTDILDCLNRHHNAE